MAQRGGVLPPLPEHGLDVVHGRAADGRLEVVPGRGVAVLLRHVVERLRVATVRGVVAARVAQVDAADVRNVSGRVVPVADDEQLLVVRATGADPHVEDRLGAALLQGAAQAQVLVGGEADGAGVRAPDQAAYVDPALVRATEHLGDLAARLAGEPLVGVALPVGEEDQVALAGGLDPLVELGEVRRPVHQRPDQVALRPGLLARVPVVQPGRGVAALLLAQQPVGGVGHPPTLPDRPGIRRAPAPAGRPRRSGLPCGRPGPRHRWSPPRPAGWRRAWRCS